MTKSYNKIMLMVLLLLQALSSYAYVIKGTIVDGQNNPIRKAVVIGRNSANKIKVGVETDPFGQFASVNVKDSTYMVFAFDSIKDVISVAHVITGYYKSNNSLYSNPHDNRLYLVMYRNHNTEDEMKRVGLKTSEYGFFIKTIYSSRDFFDEHFKLIIKDEALQRLAEI